MSTNEARDVVLSRLTELLHRQIGLRLDPSLWGRLRRCIRDDAAEHGQDVEAYLHTVSAHPGALQGLVDRVTVQESSFFRHPEHFDALSHRVLPALSVPVRIWSAACANGQEAFSLAMLLEELGIPGTVVATDVSHAALTRTAEAYYNTRELTGLSPERIARHLSRSGDGWQINQSIRDRVTVERHNLLDSIPDALSGAEVVFCRNVLIYFTPQHARAFLDRAADRLPDATFFLGSAEAIWPLTDRFETIEADGTFFYRPQHHVPFAKKPVAAAPPQPSFAPRDDRRPPVPPVADDGAAARLSRTGQEATAAGAHHSAVVAFRKCAYLTPGDPMTHLHLGLALDATGDRLSALRAYAAARHALLDNDPAYLVDATEGYTRGELVRLLDTKLEVSAP